MTIFFAGSSPADFAVSDGSAPNLGSDTASTHCGPYLNCALDAGSGSAASLGASPAMTPILPLSNPVWVHNYYYSGSHNYWSPTGEIFKLFDSSGVARLSVTLDTTTNLALYKINAAGVATLLASGTTPLSISALYELNLFVDYQTAGSVTLYNDANTPYLTYTGDVTTDGVTSLAQVGFANRAFGGDQNDYISGCIVSDSDTRGALLVPISIDGAGTINTFDSGNFSNINNTQLNDTSYLSSLTSGEVFKGTTSTTIPTGVWNVEAVSISARTNVGTGGGPAHANIILQTNDEIDYIVATIDSPFAYFDNVVTVLNTNPHTGSAWSVSDLTGMQLGIQSEA